MLRTMLAAVSIWCLAGCAAEVIDEPEVEVEGTAEALSTTVNLHIDGFTTRTVIWFGLRVTLEAGGSGSFPNVARIKYETPSLGTYQSRGATLVIHCGSASSNRTKTYVAHVLPPGFSEESPAFFCPNNLRLISADASVKLSGLF